MLSCSGSPACTSYEKASELSLTRQKPTHSDTFSTDVAKSPIASEAYAKNEINLDMCKSVDSLGYLIHNYANASRKIDRKRSEQLDMEPESNFSSRRVSMGI